MTCLFHVLSYVLGEIPCEQKSAEDFHDFKMVCGRGDQIPITFKV